MKSEGREGVGGGGALTGRHKDVNPPEYWGRQSTTLDPSGVQMWEPDHCVRHDVLVKDRQNQDWHTREHDIDSRVGHLHEEFLH